MKERTTFVIAHRLSTVRNATRILVFDHGRIVETGSFDELIQRGGAFAALAKAQFLVTAAPEAARTPVAAPATGPEPGAGVVPSSNETTESAAEEPAT
jgi:ATP-binding cassette subfamily B protein